jgi:hypothetical protein
LNIADECCNIEAKKRGPKPKHSGCDDDLLSPPQFVPSFSWARVAEDYDLGLSGLLSPMPESLDSGFTLTTPASGLSPLYVSPERPLDDQSFNWIVKSAASLVSSAVVLSGGLSSEEAAMLGPPPFLVQGFLTVTAAMARLQRSAARGFSSISQGVLRFFRFVCFVFDASFASDVHARVLGVCVLACKRLTLANGLEFRRRCLRKWRPN